MQDNFEPQHLNAAPEKDRDMVQWRREVREHFANIRISSPDEGLFRAGQRHVQLGEVELFDMSTDAHTVEQPETMGNLQIHQRQLCKISLQFDGVTKLTQDGRTAVLRPGDMALYVTQRPYTLHYDNPQRSLVIQFPQEYLHLVADQVSQVTATPVSRAEGLGQFAVPLFEQLADNLHLLEGPHALSLVRSALEMVVTVLLEASKDQGRDAQENPLFQQAVAYIDDHLADPDLGPAQIAEHFYVSLRQVHARFAEHGVTAGSYIRDQRVQKIRDALADPARQAETVQAISSRYGLTDASYVSKLFKQTFGETPSGYRRRIFY